MNFSIVFIHTSRCSRNQYNFTLKKITDKYSTNFHIKILLFKWINSTLRRLDNEKSFEVTLIQIMWSILFNDFKIIVVSFGCPGRILLFFFTNFDDQIFWFERLSYIGHKLIHYIRYNIPVFVPPFYSNTNLSFLINLRNKVSTLSCLLNLCERIKFFLF